MKAGKEITIAVAIGLVFGLVVVGGIIRAKSALDKVQDSKPSSSIQVSGTPAPQTDNQLVLELSTPDNQVLENSSLLVTGKTDPQGYIVILGEKGEYITTPGKTGTFSQEITLVKGANTIRITVYLENGTKVEKTLTAIYTSGV